MAVSKREGWGEKGGVGMVGLFFPKSLPAPWTNGIPVLHAEMGWG